MIKRKTENRYVRYMNRRCGRQYWDEYDVREIAPRKIKTFFVGTRRSENRERLEKFRKQERCQHGNWGTVWSPIAGEEWRSEPDHDYCIDCGMTEMEFEARNGNKFWQRHYPQRQSNSRWRAIKRLKHRQAVSACRKWEAERNNREEQS